MASRLIKNQVIIPRGFGGIRTTLKNRPRKGDREDLAVSGQLHRRDSHFDYTERIWRYQDNYEISREKIRDYTEDLAVSGHS